MNKKLTILLLGLFFAFAFVGAQTPVVGEWGTYNDGVSSITITEAVETIGGRSVTTYTLAGTVRAGGAWQGAGATLEPNEATLAALKSGKGITFKVQGSGGGLFQMLLSNITDDAHYASQFSARRNETTVTINYTSLRQPSWGTRVTFNTNNIFAFNIAVVNAGNFDFKVYDIQILQ